MIIDNLRWKVYKTPGPRVLELISLKEVTHDNEFTLPDITYKVKTTRKKEAGTEVPINNIKSKKRSECACEVRSTHTRQIRMTQNMSQIISVLINPISSECASERIYTLYIKSHLVSNLTGLLVRDPVPS